MSNQNTCDCPSVDSEELFDAKDQPIGANEEVLALYAELGDISNICFE
jgi:hypothetical protein